MSDLWGTVKSWFTQNAQHYYYLELDDPNATIQDIMPNRHYFRVWLTEMFLTNSRNWFTNLYPAVNAQVKLTFAGQPGTTFSQMAAPSKEMIGPGVFQNYALTPLMPFSGGTVELLSGLMAVQGAGWKTVVKVLERFSGLVAPPLGQTLSLASQVTGAISDFVEQSNGNVHLGLHQSFASAGGGGPNKMKSRYLTVIGAPKANYDGAVFSVVNGQLHIAENPGLAPVALDGVDYMLFRIEGRDQRDDWQFPNILEPWQKARAAFQTGKVNDGKEFKAAAIAAALTSPDLTMNDQSVYSQIIKADIEQMEQAGQGAAAPVAFSPQAVIEAHRDAVGRGRPVLEVN